MGGDATDKEPVEFSKTPFEEVTAPRKIRSVRFSLMSPQEIGKCGVFHVFERNLYQMPQRVPLANGILDPRMVRPSATAQRLLFFANEPPTIHRKPGAAPSCRRVLVSSSAPRL